MGSLDGKVALVTGAAQGIGRALADGLAAEGARIVVADLRGAEEAAASYDGGVGITANVADEDDVRRLTEAAVAQCGGIDLLVNNAGLYASLEMRPFDQIPLAEWRQVMDVNVASMFLTARAVVPVMRGRGGGKIVNISSGTPFRGVPFLLHYVTSKGAIVAFTRALARELGKDAILVNNAGLYASLEMRPFDQIPLEEWRQVMDVNVASMFLMAREVVPVMRARGGGRIVNISSGTPFRGVPFLLHYVTSKGAIVAFTRALAKELGNDGVLVNCVAPGFTMSAGVEAHPEVIEKLRDVSIAARTIQRDQLPEDVVGAVVYLCGPGAAFVTGQTIVIDGGQYFH